MMSAAKMNAKKIIARVKSARTQLETLLKDRTWIDEAKKVAEKQGKEVKKIIHSDVAKLRVFLEKEKKELEKLQSQIPGEVARIKKFVEGQKKEISKLIRTVKTTARKKATTGKTASKPKKRGATSKKRASSRSGSGVSAHSAS